MGTSRSHSSLPIVTSVPADPVAPLRLLRVARGLSQASLAERCGLSRATVSRLERGVEKPWPRTAQTIAAELGFARELVFPLQDEGPEPPEPLATTTPANGARDRDPS